MRRVSSVFKQPQKRFLLCVKFYYQFYGIYGDYGSAVVENI